LTYVGGKLFCTHKDKLDMWTFAISHKPGMIQ